MMQKFTKTMLRNSSRVMQAARSNSFRTGLVVAAFAVFFSAALPAILGLNKARAFSDFTQTDWSGGVGDTDPTTQYSSVTNATPAANGITVGTDENVSDWCNTANCDINWGGRKLIYFSNNSSTQLTDFQITFKVYPDVGMSADFSDLRFVSPDGLTDYNYFIMNKVDGDHAEVMVKVPTVEPGRNTFYMYSGNSNASSLSDRASTAQFSANFTDFASASPVWGNDPDIQYQNDEAYIPQGHGTNTLNHPYDLSDTGLDHIGEFDLKIDLSGTTDCSQNYGSGYLKFTQDYGNTSSEFFAGTNIVSSSTGQCGPLARWYFGNFNYSGHGGDWDTGGINQGNQAHFLQGQYVRIRYINRASGGVEVYYSADGGSTYVQINTSFNGNTQQYKSVFLFAADYFPFTVRNLYAYRGSTSVTAPVGGAFQWRDGRIGSLVSAPIDMGEKAYFGKVHYDFNGAGWTSIKVRSSDNADMSDAADWDSCAPRASGDNISDSGCFTLGKRYLQYQVTLSGAETYLQVTSVTLEHDNDTGSPSNASNIELFTASDLTTPITAGAWTRTQRPYIKWDAGADNVGGSGIKGYCAYVGVNGGENPAGNSGVLPNRTEGSYSGIDTAGACMYATANTHLDLSSFSSLNIESGQTIYITIRALDNAGNLTTDPALQTNFKYDSTPPFAATLITYPSAVNNKRPKVSWLYVPGMTGFFDNESGMAGIKYCVSSAITGFAGCNENDNNWYGAAHGSGNIHDPTDVFDPAAGELTVSDLDASRLDDTIAGFNSISVAIVDNAGNIQLNPELHIFEITYSASNGPKDLTVTPTSSNSNSYSFSWVKPDGLHGSAGSANYCWTVNVSIAADQSNCNWTGKGITELAAGPYATKQGVNTFYIATKDVTGNFDNTKVSSVTFSATTIAPGVPQDLDISDVSIRSTSAWKLATTWNAPDQPGSGIAKYKILRSTNNTDFTEVGSTSASNTSFIDTNLSQTDYYYKVKACDNADSCGIASNSVTKKPTGRFTEPAKLTADTDQPKLKDVTTRKATIFWFTDRDSDSKVAIGKEPSKYFSEEIGNSQQTSSHSVNLTNLEPGTKYYFVTKWTDTDGNTGQSVERSFTTLPAPTISDVSPEKVTVSSTEIRFSIKDASKVSLYYGKNEGFGAVKATDTSSELSTYSIPLTDLDDGVKYFFKINGFDSDGNEYQGNIYSFTTPARPRITNLRNESMDGEPSSTRKIKWTTNVPASSQLSYAPKNGKSTDVVNSALVVDHEVIIRGLEDDTDYQLTVRSVDAAGNVATSEGNPFHTATDTRPPKISDINVETSIKGNSGDARGQAVISWKTDELATSQVAYGQGEGSVLTSKTPQDARLTLEHTMVISDLSVASIYRLQPISQDKSQNSVIGQAQTAIIGRASDNIFTIIFDALRKTFGIKQ